MESGKVPNEVLENIILRDIVNKRKEVLIGPGVGEDCSAIDFGGDICVISSDPITGSTKDIGRLTVHINLNDLASSGAEPIGLMVTILAPVGSKEEELAEIMSQLITTAKTVNVDIIGGHTEVTSAVNRFVVMSTAIGKVKREKLVSTGGAKPGDSILLTKWAGLEGTAIIASEKEDELRGVLLEDELNEAKSYFDKLSVIPEGMIASNYGLSSMHDVTEGGILGAAWELAEASDKGIEIYYDKILISKVTKKICKHYNIDPLRLISSGCMLICCKDGEELSRKLTEASIPNSIIGVVTEDTKKLIVLDGEVKEIEGPKSDELYKVIK